MELDIARYLDFKAALNIDGAGLTNVIVPRNSLPSAMKDVIKKA